VGGFIQGSKFKIQNWLFVTLNFELTMKSDKASQTAQYMALFRAIESHRPASDKLFTDPFAIHFLSPYYKFVTRLTRVPGLRSLVQRIIYRRIPGAFSSAIARTRYIDDWLQRAFADGARQLIILGAGFDTRGARLGFLESAPVIEIDHPNTSARKSSMLQKAGKHYPAHIKLAQIDFNRQSLETLAAEHAIDYSLPTAILWEGVTNYLDPPAIDSTFAWISRFAPGSYIIFTYVHKQVLSDPSVFYGGTRLLQDLNAIQERWTFGFDPSEVATYLNRFGFALLEDLGAAQYRNQYIPHRTERGYEFYRVAIARRIN
jgi:methyltransferase (TIGR00027 family)